MPEIGLTSSIDNLFMVGPSYVKRLQKLGIYTVYDLLYHFPFRYDDFSNLSKINNIRVGETVTVRGEIIEIKNIFTKNGKKLTKAKITDSSGAIEAIWFNQIYLTKTLKVGTIANFAGVIGFFGHLVVLESPNYELINNTKNITIHTGRLVPIYPETYGLSSKWLRSRIFPLLTKSQLIIADSLPKEILLKNNYVNLTKAIQGMHFPQNQKEVDCARARLAFDELFLLSLFSQKMRLEQDNRRTGKQFMVDDKKVAEYISSLSFTLTNAQIKVVAEILSDLKLSRPMNRMLEGDVGSGKTVVASIAMLVSYLNGYQSALMAPTEILANQHYTTLTKLLSPIGLKIALKTGASKINNEKYDIIVGTHALLQNKFSVDNLSLVVIDEQQRFGVEQRSMLLSKGVNTHILTMTATPIPRTVALTIYGDLDLSVIDELPKGRKIIKTWLVPNSKRQNAYKWIEKQIQETSCQVFLVCPFIEESETMQTVKAVKKEFEFLKNSVYPHLKLDLLHGKMKPKEKTSILENFRLGKTQILVSTPIVEVGIDIPNASIMVIEAADRFGLSQLHQLRGRVGRGKEQAYCLLFTQNENENVSKRLKCLETNFVGPVLAELDLKMRGPGEIYGLKQHGLGNLKVASLFDEKLVKKAREEAKELLNKDPALKSFPLLNKALEKLKIDSSTQN